MNDIYTAYPQFFAQLMKLINDQPLKKNYRCTQKSHLGIEVVLAHLALDGSALLLHVHRVFVLAVGDHRVVINQILGKHDTFSSSSDFSIKFCTFTYLVLRRSSDNLVLLKLGGGVVDRWRGRRRCRSLPVSEKRHLSSKEVDTNVWQFPHLVFLDAEEDVTLALPPLPPLLFLPDDLAAAAALFLAIAEICRESVEMISKSMADTFLRRK